MVRPCHVSFRFLALKLFAVHTFLLGSFVASGQNSEQTAQINAVAGVAPILSLVCSDVDFGVWRIPVRNGPRQTKVTLVHSNNGGSTTIATLSEHVVGVAQASTFGPAEVGTCTVRGSQHPGQRIGVSILGTGELALAPANKSRLPPAAQKAQGISVSLRLSEPNALIGQDGQGVFTVVGDFNIPAQIRSANHGGYSTQAFDPANTLIVIVRDEVQP
jgi:hypothetical protein